MAVSSGLLEVMKLAATMPAEAFVDSHVLAGHVEICTPEEYLALRAEVAHKLVVPDEDIRLIGSAKLGFSLNQDHLLKLFGGRSDFLISSSRHRRCSTMPARTRRERRTVCTCGRGREEANA